MEGLSILAHVRRHRTPEGQSRKGGLTVVIVDEDYSDGVYSHSDRLA